jgi:hypothetical protein
LTDNESNSVANNEQPVKQESEQQSPDVSDGLIVGYEAARKAFPAQVDAALGYAAENTYDYGPRLRNVPLAHEVVSARLMEEGIVRVELSYRPASVNFRGASGSEYLDVDSTGAVLARRQILVPKEQMPWVLISVAAGSVLAALILVPFILLRSPAVDDLYVAGRTLWVRSERPKLQPYLSYNAEDTEGIPRTWLIVPEGEGTAIAWIDITLINQTSGSVNLSIDSDAAELTTEDGIIFTPINVFERVRWPAEGAEVDPRMDTLLLPLWGSRVLDTNQQIEGFLAFEVPSGSKFKALRWAATDVANIRY